jgi:hypothetical protein
MVLHPIDNPLLPSNPEADNSPNSKEGPIHPEIPYALPHEEVNQFRRITRAYTWQIETFPFTPILPQRKEQSILVLITPDEVFVHFVKDLIYFVITKIQEPLDLIPKTPAGDIFEHDKFSEEEYFDFDSEDMEGNDDHGEEIEFPL